MIFDKFKKKLQGSKATKDDFVKIRQVQVATYLMLSIGGYVGRMVVNGSEYLLYLKRKVQNVLKHIATRKKRRHEC